MAKKEPERPRQVNVLATLKDERYRVNMFFNRFCVEPIGRHLLIHFGLLHSRNLLASYTCLLEEEALKASRDSMLIFLDGMSGSSESPDDVWSPPLDCNGVEACNIMHMARTGQIGEVRIGLYSSGVVMELRKGTQAKVEVAANALALLHCDLDVQKRLLEAVYVNHTP